VKRNIKLRILDPRIGREFPLPQHATAGIRRHGFARLHRRTRWCCRPAPPN
jgi:hypothetical protein